jgi:hypothetical protein
MDFSIELSSLVEITYSFQRDTATFFSLTSCASFGGMNMGVVLIANLPAK